MEKRINNIIEAEKKYENSDKLKSIKDLKSFKGFSYFKWFWLIYIYVKEPKVYKMPVRFTELSAGTFYITPYDATALRNFIETNIPEANIFYSGRNFYIDNYKFKKGDLIIYSVDEKKFKILKGF